jgi:hypothetical protein
MATRRIAAVPTVFGDDRDDIVVLAAPGRRGQREHPAAGTLEDAMTWLTYFRRNLRDGMGPGEADTVACAQYWEHKGGHYGKGRRFQPASQR